VAASSDPDQSRLRRRVVCPTCGQGCRTSAATCAQMTRTSRRSGSTSRGISIWRTLARQQGRILKLDLPCDAASPLGAYGGIDVDSRQHIIVYLHEPPRAFSCMSQCLWTTSIPGSEYAWGGSTNTRLQFLYYPSHDSRPHVLHLPLTRATEAVLFPARRPIQHSSQRPRAGLDVTAPQSGPKLPEREVSAYCLCSRQ
jgi:hypothetical protein